MKRALAIVLVSAALLAGCSRNTDPVSAVAAARALVQQGKPGEARIVLKRLLSAHPQTAPARVLLSQIALDEGDAQAASDEISTLDDTALQAPEALQTLVRVEIAVGKPDEALKRLQSSGQVIAEPDRALLVASAYRALESPADGLAVLREVQATKGTSEALVLGIAETLAAMGNFEPAAAELDRYLAQSPVNRADALRMRGDVNLRQGKPKEAAADFRAALDAAPAAWPRISRISTHLMVADALIAAGQVDAAKSTLGVIEKEAPGTLGATVLLGQIALLEGRYDEAVERLDSPGKAGASNPRIQYLLVEALMKSGDTVRASQLLEQLVASEPESSPSRRVLATLFMQQGRPDRVIDVLGADAEAGVSDGTNEDDDLLAAARLARETAARAISTLTAKLAAAPSDMHVRAELAAAQLENGEPALALDTLGPFVDGRQDPLAIGTRMFAYYSSGNDLEANRVLDRLLNTNAGADLPVLLAAAEAAARQQQNAAVSRLLDRAATLAPKNTEVQIRRASLAFADHKYGDAKAILADVLLREPGNTGAQLALARVSESGGDVVGSRAVLTAAATANPAAVEPALMLASLELRAGKAEDASKALDSLIESNKAAMAPNAAGLLLARSGRYEEARTRFRQAIDREPGNAEYWFNLGEAQLALKDTSAAKESFLHSAELQPDSIRAGLTAVRLSIELKDLTSARRASETLVSKLPDSSTAWLLMGEVEAASDKPAEAASAFARSYSARPNSAAASREFAARVAANMQRPEEPLLRWLAHEPADTAARLMLSDYHLANGREDEAREQLEIIVKQAPNDVAALNNLAWVLRVSAPQRAESLARRASAIAPDNSAIADTLGVILLNNGKVEEAIPLLAKAAAAMPNDRNVQVHYAMSLSKAGQKEKARGILDRALQDKQAFPDRDAAKRLLEELG